MFGNSITLALQAIFHNLTRSMLTVLGVVIGVAAVVTMVTLGGGATQAVSQQIESLGSNLLMVRPGQRLGPQGQGAPDFKLSDAEAVADLAPEVKAVAPTANASATVVRLAKNWSTVVTGTTGAYLEVRQWPLAAGRSFSEIEERSGRSVCIIGETVRRELFGGGDPVGEQIRVKSFACEVIGLLTSKAQASMGGDQDDTVLMPLRTVQRRLTGDRDIGALMISVTDADAMERAKADIERVLRERRKLGPAEDNDFNLLDTRQIAETLSGTTRVLTMLLGAVAAVSLLVGGIGIMNIMLVSVTERTREIGIRLAIGARERDVLLQFLVEAVMLSALGGLIGLALALAASAGLAQLMKVPFVFNPAINGLAFGVSSLVGVVFGYFPARRAAWLDPIEALRHE